MTIWILISLSNYLSILHRFIQNPERDYWTPEVLQEVSKKMLNATSGDPIEGDTLLVDKDYWNGLANDLKAAKTISPLQYASEISRTVKIG